MVVDVEALPAVVESPSVAPGAGSGGGSPCAVCVVLGAAPAPAFWRVRMRCTACGAGAAVIPLCTAHARVARDHLRQLVAMAPVKACPACGRPELIPSGVVPA